MGNCGCDSFTNPGAGFVSGGGGDGNPDCCGALAMSIWDLPSTPHAADDEFQTGSALDAAWSVVVGTMGATAIDPYAAFAAGDSRVSVNTRRPSWLMVQPVSGTTFGITKLVTPVANFAVWYRGAFNHRNIAAINNDQSIGLMLTTNPFDVNNRLTIYLNESDAGVIQAEFQSVVAGVATTVGTTLNKSPLDHTAFEGCLIQRFGATNTYHAWALTNNGSAVHLGSVVFAPTVAQAGFLFSDASVVAPGNMIMGVDFIRFADSAVFLP